MSIGAGSRNSLPAAQLFELIASYAPGDQKLRQRAAALIAQEHSMRLLNIRGALRAVIGAGPGPEGALTKLLSAEHAQAVTELAMEIAGTAAVTNENAATAHMTFEYLFARCLSIAGGTSEITRNVISAQKAYEWGMVNRVLPAAELRAFTLATAQQMLRTPTSI